MGDKVEIEIKVNAETVFANYGDGNVQVVADQDAIAAAIRALEAACAYLRDFGTLPIN